MEEPTLPIGVLRSRFVGGWMACRFGMVKVGEYAFVVAAAVATVGLGCGGTTSSSGAGGKSGSGGSAGEEAAADGSSGGACPTIPPAAGTGCSPPWTIDGTTSPPPAHCSWGDDPLPPTVMPTVPPSVAAPQRWKFDEDGLDNGRPQPCDPTAGNQNDSSPRIAFAALRRAEWESVHGETISISSPKRPYDSQRRGYSE